MHSIYLFHLLPISLVPIFISENRFKMLRILSRVARKLGLLAVHVTVVREKSGSMRVIESTFPLSPPIEVSFRG